jgi:hypothetical protein
METGDEGFLRDALQNWAVVQGRNNKDYYDKYRKFRNYHTGLDDKDKFIFVGIDKIQDMELTARFLHRLEINSTDTLSGSIEMEDVLHKLASLEEVYKESPDTAFLLSHLKANLDYVETKKNREHVMFENFHGLYTKWNHVDKRAYGYFGLYHVFQYSINGRQPFAAQVRASDLGLENSILSINFLMVDSYMVMPSAQIPEFMRDSGAYSRMPISSDVMLFMYIYGIKDFKRMTPENHKSFIKMNAENSPYGATSRMNKTIQLLPVVDKMEFSEPGKPYIQYTVFVRNSDWAEPEMN